MNPSHAATFAFALSAVALLGGCAAPARSGPYAPLSEATRDPSASQRLTQEAVEVAERDPVRAEQLLREALNVDLYNGPAHNNLGTLYLNRGDLYAAAGEFEWARQLLPGHPDPRMNLALTLEKAGKVEEALTTYATALEVYPEHIPTMQAMARLQLRSGKVDPTTHHMLEQIALRGEDDRWREWAQLQALKLAR